MQPNPGVVVVTGASSGVGRALSRELGTRGAKVALIARGKEALGNTAREVEALGGEALELSLDVADPTAVKQAAKEVMAKWGQIDSWVNNAMVSVIAPAEELTPHELERVTAVTYLGTVYGTLAALEHMRERNKGTIVQIGSALTYRSIPLQSAYCAAKAAVRGFTDSLRCELIHEKCDVALSMVQLPAVNTPQFDTVRTHFPQHARPPLPIYEPELVAKELIRLLEKPRREAWIGSSVLRAMLAQDFIPGAADRYLARHAWETQFDSRLSRSRVDNLDAPVPGDRGAHGAFSDESSSFSALTMLRNHPIAAVGVAAAAGVLVSRLVQRLKERV